jgi:DNA invertase Pin-like site-specific DNA recombinase
MCCERKAHLYVRQSSMQQVFENTESTEHQYTLKQRAGVVLGLELSRLARNNSDWHRLLETCAIGDSLKGSDGFVQLA